jgi:hypothetical protein
MPIYRFLLVFLFLPLLGIKAQNLNFINIDADQGLPSNECYRITQDKRGYIWISTDAGLVKYNSKEFVLFDKSKGMPSSNVYALDLDTASGRLWFATSKWEIGYIANDSVTILKEISFFNDVRKTQDIIYKIKYSNTNNCLYLSTHFQSIKIFKTTGGYISAPLKNEVSNNNSFLAVTDEFIGNNFNPVLRGVYDPKMYENVYLFNDKKDSLKLPINFEKISLENAFPKQWIKEEFSLLSEIIFFLLM